MWVWIAISNHGVAIAGIGVAVALLWCAWRLVWGYPQRGAADATVRGAADRSGAFRVRFAVMGAREAALVHAAALAFFPADGPIARSGVDAGCVRWFDRYLARCQPGHRRLVMLLLWFNEYGPLVFGPRRARLTRLSAAERLRFLEESARSGWYLRRVSTLTLRGLMTMAYMTDPAILRQIGALADLDPFGLAHRDDIAVPPPTVSGERLKVDVAAYLEEEDVG